MTAYYNEIDPFAAQWLRNLINAGHIAPGIVDERSIEDVFPSDLRGFTQCHFFAGIGVWSHALRLAGWSDSRPVWTGSCPCQPFSAAGQGAGFDDERHLWPHWHHLIKECRPAVILGEQVASSDSGPWLDLVQDDLEELVYAFGAVPFPAAGVGAPHIRDRLYWVADAMRPRSLPGAHLRVHRGKEGIGPWDGKPQRSRTTIRLEHARQHNGAGEGQAAGTGQPKTDRSPDQLGRSGFSPCSGPGPTNGLWSAVDWLCCRDGKWRPVEPGTFPLVDGAPARVGRLRAYGNAIVAPQAQAFVEAVMDCVP